jgi:short chain dehydrogenase
VVPDVISLLRSWSRFLCVLCYKDLTPSGAVFQRPGRHLLHKRFCSGDNRFKMKTLNSKVAIVTGASGGIGAAIARRFESDGFAVVVNYADFADAAKSLVNEIENAGGRALAVRVGVSDSLEVSRLFETAEKEFGGVDVLVNNAGPCKPMKVASC